MIKDAKSRYRTKLVQCSIKALQSVMDFSAQGFARASSRTRGAGVNDGKAASDADSIYVFNSMWDEASTRIIFTIWEKRACICDINGIMTD